jgi:hypothetical protein
MIKLLEEFSRQGLRKNFRKLILVTLRLSAFAGGNSESGEEIFLAKARRRKVLERSERL